MKQINTIVFDMDGTTLDTLVDLAGAVNYVLTKYHMPIHKLNEFKPFFGNGIRYAFKCAVPRGTSEETIDEMIPIFKSYYDVHCLDNTRPYDGVLELMKILKEHHHKIAIVSNKIDSAVQELYQRFFKQYVDVAIGEKPGINRKPAPDMVYEALKELNSNKNEAVYIGDSEVDYQTAVNSGLDCILVLWGFRSKEQLVDFNTPLVKTPSEIFTILNTGK